MKPGVAVIDNSLVLTGALRSAVATADVLAVNYRIVFCLPNRSGAIDFVMKAGYEVEEVPFRELKRSWRSILLYLPLLLRSTWYLLSILSKKNVSVLHCNDMYNMTGALVKLVRPSITLIYHVRLMRNSYIRPAYGLFSAIVKRSADAVIFVSRAASRDFGPVASGRVIYDCVTLEGSRTSTPRMAPSSASPELLYLANYSRGKGHEEALAIFHQVIGSGCEASMRFIGEKIDPRFCEELLGLAQGYGILSRISFEGPSEDVWKSLVSSDIFLNFSKSESFSRTTLEALQAGLPVVVYDSGGIRELFEHGVGGVLVAPGDQVEAAKAIVDLCKSPSRRIELGTKGRNRVEQLFNRQEFSSSLNSLYESLLEN